MPLGTIPAKDVNICQDWTEQDNNLYNALDFYFAKKQVERRKWYRTWDRFLGKIKWTPNMGDTMRTVVVEPSPIIRQFAFPQLISSPPKKDVIQVRERKFDESVYRHRFESLQLSWKPSFVDFMTHVDDNSTDIMAKQEVFEDVYYRGRIFHNAPFCWIPDRAAGEIVAAPVGEGNAAGTDGKTTAWLQAMIAGMGQPGNLSMATLNRLITVMETDIGALPFSGPEVAKENTGMTNKFALVCDTEAYNQFSNDPFLLAHKNCNLDIINGRFQGSLFGRLTSIFEPKPLRFRSDGTFPNPETIEMQADAYNYQETIPNPVFTDLTVDNGSPYGVAFLVGAQGYENIEVGPPPSAFASNGMPKGFGKMFWNGEVILTKNLLVPCVDDQGNVTQQTNMYGEYLMFISQVTYGMRAFQRRNIIPIIYKRKRS